ncbi:hypothetical protein KZX50_00500 [Bacillus infantis]|uniref:hypothetical protein n=1 Tax=Bacillus infantis TaxID=324767 RepID=UPI0020048FF6|nr:hypothetical protein [Bacillus infantis]MCK6203927.1 hypothetical protein [Bacillus infantis]
MPLEIIDVTTGERNYVNPKDDPTYPLKKENAEIAYSLLQIENEAKTARQELADLNFTLMINGVI